MTKKPTGLEGIEPPSRKLAPVKAIETTHAGDLEAVHYRITSDRAAYVRMLAAKTRKPARVLIEEAIDLLREKAGEI